MKIIVTIPAYNEERTIGLVLQDINQVMRHNKYNYQLVVVDDGSRDQTSKIAKKFGATVIRHPTNRGLAETFRTEMRTCIKLKADVIIHTDADGQYRAAEIPKLITKLKDGYDLVLGSRFRGKIETMPAIKWWGNQAFSKVISSITGVKITDGQTGFRAFTKEVADQIKTTSTHTYTQEQIIRAAKEHFRIAEVPAHFDRRGGNTKSRLMKNPFEYAIRAWVNILRIYRDYQPLAFFGIIGGLFFGFGFLIGLYIFYLLMTTGGVGGIPRVILSAMLMLTGIQITLFGFLADMMRK
jgi:glycosyltransferase involved in cell wall biosynthesis